MTTPPMLACIADDYTGATDLAGILARRGLRVIQCFGIPRDEASWAKRDFDFVVVALKSRSLPKAQAIALSLKAAKWLQSMGATHFYFKYCSTFDSTADGNIGPVAEALMDWLSCKATVFCPAFPENHRTVYQGHLFVEGVLLHESGMRHHPLTPMSDSFLPRVLAAQSKREVGLLRWKDIADGASQAEQAMDRLLSDRKSLIVTDAICDANLATVSGLVHDWKVTTGGSAFAGHIADRWIEKGCVQRVDESDLRAETVSRSAVIAGSCSAATREQIKEFASRRPSKKIDVIAAASENGIMDELLAWMDEQSDAESLMIYTTADPNELARVQKALGKDHAAAVAEAVLAEAAVALVARGVRRLVIAGGETSGAVVNRLGIDSVRIGLEIVPGVPWIASMTEPRLSLVLKSGNFGGPSFFDDALGMMRWERQDE